VDLANRPVMLPQTKNGEGRVVYLNDMAMMVFDSAAQAGARPVDRIFADWEGYKVDASFDRARRAVGLEDFRFHDLRHTAASWLRMAGADIHTVAQLLGHKDLRMAARYQHLSPAFLAEAVGKLDVVFGVNPAKNGEERYQDVTAKLARRGHGAKSIGKK
jgi:integrase